MIECRTFVCLSVCVALACSTAQPPGSGNPRDLSRGSEDYESLLAELQGGGRDVDFRSLRFAYAQSPQYEPYNWALWELRDSMWSAMEADNLDRAFEYASAILEQNYVFPDAHYVALQVYRSRQDSALVAFHEYVFGGLVRSIGNCDDGRSPDAPIPVISIDEEYALLAACGLEMQGQALMECGGVPCDRLEVRPLDADTVFVVYFDLTMPRSGFPVR